MVQAHLVVGGQNPRPSVGVAQSANVAELVYAPDLGSGGATRESSSLSVRTNTSL